MKKSKLVLTIIAGTLLLLSVTACGSKGGTIMLVNESTHILTVCRISMGDHNEAKLNPGEWMKSGHDKNSDMFSVTFKVGMKQTDAAQSITVEGVSGSWSGGNVLSISTWTSTSISVHDGEAVVITVKDTRP